MRPGHKLHGCPYQKKGDKERLFESYYYLGGTYRDMNDVPYKKIAGQDGAGDDFPKK